MKKIKPKGQIWFNDFVIGSIIFSLLLISYYAYTWNLASKDAENINNLDSDAQAISSSLLRSGFPSNWDNNTVQSIGITNNDQSISSSKLTNLHRLSYNMTKKLFGTPYDYLIFFQNDSNAMLNVEGICSIGHPVVNVTYKVKAAYYFDNYDDAYLKDYMADTLKADIYSEQSGYDDFDVLKSKINNYDFLVIEHPLFSTNEFNKYKDSIEGFVSDGKILMLSGEIVSGQDKNMLNVGFKKKSGQSISDRNSTVVYEDPFLDLNLGENIIFAQAYYVNNNAATDYIPIAEFNSDSNDAIAKWTYGSGKVFYFSDFDVNYLNGDFVSKVEDAANRLGDFQCNPISLDNIKYNNFLKVDRYLVYKGKIIKMVLYLWN